MSDELRNSITASTGRSGLGGGGEKNTACLAAASFFRWGQRGARSLETGTKYGTAAPPSPSPAGGGGGGGDAGDAGAGDDGGGRREERLPRRSLASRSRARAPGRRNRWWSPLAAAGRERVAAMWVPGVGKGWIARWMDEMGACLLWRRGRGVFEGG